MKNLATGYRDVGMPDRSLPLLAEALQIRKAKFGPEHVETLNSMNSLAAGYLDADKVDQALPLFQELLARARKSVAKDSPYLAAYLVAQGRALLKAGAFAAAEASLREALEIREKMQRDDWNTFNTRSLLGGSLVSQKKYAEAERFLLDGYRGMNERRARIPATENRWLSEAADRLVEEYVALGKPDEAAKWRTERAKYHEHAPPPRELKNAKAGTDHSESLKKLNGLSLVYHAPARKDPSPLPQLEETLKDRKEKLGPDHPDTLTSMNDLAMAYREAGKLDLALPLLEETLKRRKEVLGSEHPHTLTSMCKLAEGHRDAGKLDLAIPLLEEAVNLMNNKLGPEHPQVLQCMNSL